MSDKATAQHQNMPIDKKIKERLAELINSKLQDDEKISDLVNKAESLKKRLHIDTDG